MAQQMDSDFKLAGAAVVFTSVLACFTMFLWIFFFRQAGFF
jgi:malate permease and related proteins